RHPCPTRRSSDLRVVLSRHHQHVAWLHGVAVDAVHVLVAHIKQGAVRHAAVARDIEVSRQQAKVARYADDEPGAIDALALGAVLVQPFRAQPGAGLGHNIGALHTLTSGADVNSSTVGLCGSPWKFSSLPNFAAQSSSSRLRHPAITL